MRLVDPTLPFSVVYSLYHHEYLEYLISSHIVQLLPNGELSLIHQGIYPDNADQFASALDDKDQELITLTAEITPKSVIKKFGGDSRKKLEFFTQKFDGQLKKLVLEYIQRRMAKLLPLLEDRSLFTMGRDGYAAQQPITFVPEKATVLFHFFRTEDNTRYFPTIKLKDERLEFMKKGARLVCYQPAWMLLNNQLFTFEREVDGKKLRPFLKKFYIEIPRATEKEYYEKFVAQIVEKYDVHEKGFRITKVRENPHFSLLVNSHDEKSFSFIRRVSYGVFTFELPLEGDSKAFLDTSGGNYTFFKVLRKVEEEQAFLAFLDKISPNPQGITPWQYVSKEKGLSWLSEHGALVAAQGVEIIQENAKYQINLATPEISFSTEEAGDWFDIKAVVRVGNFEIPFIKLKSHILRNKREFILPDNSVAILPESWFTDYRHLMEVSEQRSDDTLGIRKYQAPLLDISSNGIQLPKLDFLADIDRVPDMEVPAKLHATLRSYQKEGYNWLNFIKTHEMGGILADDMGLGKTIQTLSLLQKQKEEGAESPSLIIMPTSLIHNWLNEAKKFTPELKVYIHSGVSRTREVKYFVGYDLILTTYGIARQDVDQLKTFPFHYIILDESQMIKNPESKTARAIKKLLSRHRLSLTGTPIENTVMDIWSQMSFLNPGLLGSEAFFKKFYVHPIEKEHNEGQSKRLRKLIHPFILRRTKQQVEQELPPKIEKLHYCEMTSEQQEYYDEVRNSYRNYLLDLINQGIWKKNKLNILTGLQKLRQIAIHPRVLEPEKYELKHSGKYLEVKRMLAQVIQKKSKVLIFSQFVKMLHLLRDDLTEEGIRFAYLDGNTRDRQDRVDHFQRDESLRVFLISLKAGGVGLNLTAADYVFILDPWWNPAVENQAVDRSHRIGQHKTVFYYKFITKDSIEEKILRLQMRKNKLSSDIIQVEEDIYKSLSADDLDSLLA